MQADTLTEIPGTRPSCGFGGGRLGVHADDVLFIKLFYLSAADFERGCDKAIVWQPVFGTQLDLRRQLDALQA